MLSSKYGDTNYLKLDTILNLSSNLKQLVDSPTRLDPSQILEPIITILSKYYQTPLCLPPLDNDPSPSDHLIVFMKPIDSINNNPARKTKSLTFRPLPRSGINAMGKWIVQETWDSVCKAVNAHEKSSNLQNILLKNLNQQVLRNKQPVFTNESTGYKFIFCK